jgi:DNA phosphorothioation-dependent restriction protein DptG
VVAKLQSAVSICWPTLVHAASATFILLFSVVYFCQMFMMFTSWLLHPASSQLAFSKIKATDDVC